MVLEGFQIDGYVETNTKLQEASVQDVAFTRQKGSMEETITALLNGTTTIDTAGIQSTLEEQEYAMREVIAWYQQENESLKQILENAQASSFSVAESLNRKRESLAAKELQLKEQREIQAIREEQVASLQNRYEANAYTSWMGLTRPLEEGSRTGLLVAAGAFLLLGLLAVYYMYRVGILPIPDFFKTSGFRGGAIRNRGQR